MTISMNERWTQHLLVARVLLNHVCVEDFVKLTGILRLSVLECNHIVHSCKLHIFVKLVSGGMEYRLELLLLLVLPLPPPRPCRTPS